VDKANKRLVIVTGSAGYVGSYLGKHLNSENLVVGVDLQEGGNTDVCMDIGSSSFKEYCDSIKSKYESVTIINLAAARFDFGVSAQRYYDINVNKTTSFLRSLECLPITDFIHISSVASLDGERLSFSEQLGCDDAYRVTKFLQEEKISVWCQNFGVANYTLYPSAIFSDSARKDTNIGKLQSLTRVIPFIPKLAAKKTLTYLPHFSKYIIAILNRKISEGNYLTVERPILTVSEIIMLLSPVKRRVISIPGLRVVLTSISWGLYVLGGFGKVDMKLTPNRVKKLFSNTVYDSNKKLDLTQYNEIVETSLEEILSKQRTK
jgi:nucleoside-diphosphate-sugar epimerase